MSEEKNMVAKIIHASSMERRFLCPGSLAAEDNLPDIKSEDADSGTRIHTALRLNFTGMKKNETITLCKLDERETLVFKWFVDIAEREILSHGGAAKTWPEFKFPYVDDGLTGTADLIVRCRDRAVLLFDWKTGYGKTLHAEKNLQLRVYAVKTAETFGCVSVLAYLFSAGNAAEDSAFTSCEYGPDEIAEARKEIYAIRAACLRPAANRLPGAEQCKWCKACGNPDRCPESIEFQKQVATALTIQTPLTPAMRKQCAGVWDNIKAFEKAAKNFKQLIKNELTREPDSIPGLRLELPESVRKITNPEKVFEIGMANGWFDQVSFVQRVISVKIGELVKLVKNHLQLTEKEAAEVVNTELLREDAMRFEEKERSIGRVET